MFARKPEESDDIAQETFLLLIEHPPEDEILPKAFYFQVVRRARWNFYYYNNQKEKNSLLLFNTAAQKKMYKVKSEFDLENVLILRDLRKKRLKMITDKPKDVQGFALSEQESKVIGICLTDKFRTKRNMAEELGMTDALFGTHYINAVKKLRRKVRNA